MFTVLGSSGFIGSHLVARLRAAGEEVLTPNCRNDAYLARELGHVVYCVGVTSDFRTRPLDTVDAHVTRLMPLLRRGRFESLLYLSSTRVYHGMTASFEDQSLTVRPCISDDLYNVSKLMGETACLGSGRPDVRVARLSNVYGPGMSDVAFLASVISEAVECRRVVLRTTLDSSKDYIALEDAVGLLAQIARQGRHRIYNVAAGRSISNAVLAHLLVRTLDCTVSIAPNAARVQFPAIEIDRVADEFGMVPARLEDKLPELVKARQERMVAA